MRRPPLLAPALLAAALLSSRAQALNVPFQKSQLPNGLTVILHEDHTLPQVAVNLVYRVGSRDEEQKRTGFAHLFEHLMFMGTTRAPTKMFDRWMEASGGSNNAWTSEDLTDYFEQGPSPTLPLLLWLEADRMGTLGNEIDKAKLDLQRDVVRNERRQSIENVPYGKVELRLPELAYPESHPYHHPVIGSHEDLEAASVENVKAFFQKYYVPQNASLVVAGDFNPEEVKKTIDRDFGSLPGGRRPERMAATSPPRLGKVVRETMKDRVELGKIIIAFHSPARFAPGDAELDLLGQVLASGKASRLYKALVYDRPLAQSVSASQSSQDVSSLFEIEAVARPDVSLDTLEREIDKVLADVLAHPPTDAELGRARSNFEYHFIESLESLAARARLLNLYEVEANNPGFVDQDLQRYKDATTPGVATWTKATLTLDDRVIIRVEPLNAPVKGGKAQKGGAP